MPHESWPHRSRGQWYKYLSAQCSGCRVGLQKAPCSDLLGSVDNICSKASILLLISCQLSGGGLNQLKKTGPLSRLTKQFSRQQIYFGLNYLSPHQEQDFKEHYVESGWKKFWDFSSICDVLDRQRISFKSPSAVYFNAVTNMYPRMLFHPAHNWMPQQVDVLSNTSRVKKVHKTTLKQFRFIMFLFTARYQTSIHSIEESAQVLSKMKSWWFFCSKMPISKNN